MKILAPIKLTDLDDFHMIMSKGKSLSMRAELILHTVENFDIKTSRFSRTLLFNHIQSIHFTFDCDITIVVL